MKMGSLSYRPRSLKSLNMPYMTMTVISFFKVKKDSNFLMNTSLIKVSMWTIWSMVLLALKPVCRFERRLFDSRKHDSLRLIILLGVLQVQLVKAIGL